jgi:isopenicillin-N epimerase
MTSQWARHWTLDPGVDYLNHGSFGACPANVLAAQQALRDRLEAQPVQFMIRELEPLLDEARTALAAFVGADPAGLAFVANATTGVNTVLRSLPFEAGDELLVTDHAYGACRNALDHVASRAGARVVVVRIPFPIDAPEQVTEAVLEATSARTRLVLLDHVTSSTGLVWPLEHIVPELKARGVDVLVDGAHGPGMVPVELDSLGVAYYTANCHKWLCAAKGAAFLWVRADRRAEIRPLVISHGATSKRRDRDRFRLEFDWLGTVDPTPFLTVPVALRTLEDMLPGGWPQIRARNRGLALEARSVLCRALGIEPPAPESMIGALAAVPLPPGGIDPDLRPDWLDPLQQQLVERYRIEVPVFTWPAPPARLVRISAQLYNELQQYERLARTLRELV